MSIKTLREALCHEQVHADQWPETIRSAVDVLINMIDQHRPLDTNGKHGNLHTATCGCEDKPGWNHDERCFQRRPEGIPPDLPPNLCDCRIWAMFDARKRADAS